MKHFTKNGMMYTEDIISMNGAKIVLFPDAFDSAKQIADAKAEINDMLDVVSLREATEEDRDDLYNSEIFSDPRTKDLRWYEINNDRTLMRQERDKGTTATEFVSRYVLPFTEVTKQLYLSQYGEGIIKV